MTKEPICAVVVYMNQEQRERLWKLLPWQQGYTETNGTQPNRNWTERALLEMLVNNYLENHLNDILSEEERRQGFAPAVRRKLFRKWKRVGHKSLTLNRIQIRDKISIRHRSGRVNRKLIPVRF